MHKDTDLQVNSKYYFNPGYDNKDRFLSYWQQINQLQKLNSQPILEIGVGNGLVSQYLKQRSMEILTLDIAAELQPDIIGDVRALPFAQESFAAVACFEVLEHIPYQEFFSLLKDIRRITRQYVLLSLPDCSRSWRFFTHLPVLGILKFNLPLIPGFRAPRHEFDGQHYWEIGKASFALRRIKGDICKAGFSIQRTFRIFEAPWYRFFILEKK